MLRTHIPFTLAHDPSDEHFNYQRHYVCTCNMNVEDMQPPLPELHILLVRKRTGILRFE